jgi:sterol desaturase/sphingolipid hydroxylase (fatty acid hydroxylase superfamily)
VLGTAPTEDPAGGLASLVPRALLLGGAAKLFAAAPMVPEAFLWSVLSWTAFEVVNHDEPSYRWTQGGPLRRLWFGLLGGGAWHQMHHSARPGHEAVNLSGFPFQIWDRLFGTYVAPEPAPPPFGLTGRDHLVRNPLRIAFAGWIQLGAELRRNPGLATRAKVLFGATAWSPPHAVHVLTRPGVAERA